MFRTRCTAYRSFANVLAHGPWQEELAGERSLSSVLRVAALFTVVQVDAVENGKVWQCNRLNH